MRDRIVSLLYVPGDDSSKLEGSLGRTADAIIIDLEDAVSKAELPAARDAVGRFLDGLAGAEEQARPEILLRVNAGDLGVEDLRVAWRPAIGCVVVPKVGSAHDLTGILRALEDLEASVGSARRTTSLMPMIETASGVERLDEICTTERVVQLQIGEVDLAADLGVFDEDAAQELFGVIRSTIVLKSRHFGLRAPVAPVDIHFRELDRFAQTTERLLASGFGARACIHPGQVEVIGALTQRWNAEADAATLLIESYQHAQRQGRGVFVGPDGEMVDQAVVELAERRISRRR